MPALGWGCQGCRGIGGHWGLDMKNADVYCKVLLKTQDGLLQTLEHELRSMVSKFVPLFAMRSLYLGIHLSPGQLNLSTGLGHHMPLTGELHLTTGQPNPKVDQISSWHNVVSLLATRCLYCGGISDKRPAWPKGWPNIKLTWDACTRGVHLTWVHLTTCLCDQSSHTHGHKMSLPGSRVSLTFCLIGSQPANQPASCNWPANQPCDKISTCQAWGWSDIWWQGGSSWHFVW